MNIFDSWTPESSYLLGLFYADGHLPPRLNTANLTTKDEQLAGLVHALIPESTKKLRGNTYRVYLRHWAAKSLHAMGLLAGNRAGKLKWPAHLPAYFTRDFIRGFFDGDGSTSVNTPHLTFCSTSLTFLKYIEAIGYALTCYRKQIKWAVSCYQLHYRSVVDVALWTMYMYLYPTTHTCLLRKRDCLFSNLGVKQVPDTPDLHSNLTYHT